MSVLCDENSPGNLQRRKGPRLLSERTKATREARNRIVKLEPSLDMYDSFCPFSLGVLMLDKRFIVLDPKSHKNGNKKKTKPKTRAPAEADAEEDDNAFSWEAFVLFRSSFPRCSRDGIRAAVCCRPVVEMDREVMRDASERGRK